MSIGTVTLDNTPAQIAMLNQVFLRSGLCSIRFSVPGPGPWYFSPLDSRRAYLLFSLESGALPIKLIPGDDNGASGITLVNSYPNYEIGGKLMHCLLSSKWQVDATGATNFCVLSIRDC